MSRAATQQKWTLAFFALHDAYTNFILPRQAINNTPTGELCFTLLGQEEGTLAKGRD